MEARLGEVERVWDLLQQGLAKVGEPRGRASLLSLQGGLLTRQERWEAAEQAFRRALELDEREPLIYYFAVDLLALQGRLQEACEHLRRALQLRVRKTRHRRKIEQARRRLGCR